MSDLIIRTNVVALYSFLSFIEYRIENKTHSGVPKILDCGAGGSVPPLALFYQQGFDCRGIDISDDALDSARKFCEKHKLSIDLRKGDMRDIPFDDNTFDYVYEQYAMCHLTKKDHAKAISEMRRVLKEGGYCFLGIQSIDTNPMYGKQKEPGEFWLVDDDGNSEIHSQFSDEEADELLAGWTVLNKEKRIIWNRERWNKMSFDEWLADYDSVSDQFTDAEWRGFYDRRMTDARFAHSYFLLRK